MDLSRRRCAARPLPGLCLPPPRLVTTQIDPCLRLGCFDTGHNKMNHPGSDDEPLEDAPLLDASPPNPRRNRRSATVTAVTLYCFVPMAFSTGNILAIEGGVDYRDTWERRHMAGRFWKSEVLRIFKSPLLGDGTTAVVTGRAPHAVYTWIGMAANRRVRLIARRETGEDFRVPRDLELVNPYPVTRVNAPQPNDLILSPAVFFFVGMPGHTVLDDLQKVHDVCRQRELVLEAVFQCIVPEQRITPDNFATTLGSLGASIRSTLMQVPSGRVIFVLMSVPTQISLGVGRLFARAGRRQGTFVRMVDLVNGQYQVYD